MELLSDNEVYWKASDVLAQLSEQGDIFVQSRVALLKSIAAESRLSIQACMPQIVQLLKDNDRDVRIAGVDTLAKLSKQGNLNISVNSRVVLLISIVAEFHKFIQPSIPQIVELLNDKEMTHDEEMTADEEEMILSLGQT